jgi:signal transduction histidine kinase
LHELQRFGAELDQVIEDVRTAASGARPRELALYGVAAALRSLARSAPMPVAVEDRDFGRRSELGESTVFFCCAEALQNATKHAGPGRSVTVRLSHSDGWLQFSVQDGGVGFDPGQVARGRGLDNMTDRLAAVGGSLVIDSTAGQGTRVSGRLPADS